MSVNVRIPTILRTYTGGAAEVPAEGATLAEVIESLEKSHPGIAARVLDDQGKLRRFVNVYVNATTCASRAGCRRRRRTAPASRSSRPWRAVAEYPDPRDHLSGDTRKPKLPPPLEAEGAILLDWAR